MSRFRRGALIVLLWAGPAGAVVLEAPAPPVSAVPTAPAQLALGLLNGAAAVLPLSPLPAFLPPSPAAAVAAAPVVPMEAAKAERTVQAALPVLAKAGPLAGMKPAESAAVLSKLFEGFAAEGLLSEPAPVTSAAEAAANTGLTAAQLGLLEKHGAPGGLVTVEHFLRKEPLPDGGYLLGTSHRSVYASIAAAVGLTHFAEVYQELYGRVLMDATDRFLDFITGTGEKIVFLLPPKALEHPGVTNEELKWFLEHPERMANVRFVLGAYEFVKGDVSGRREEAERALELWRGGHERAGDEKRLAQRRRHRANRGEAEPAHPEGEARAAAIESFLFDMQHAYYGKDRGSTGRFFFQGSHGTRILHRAERGLFLEYSTPDGWAEIFVSKRGEPDLYRRLWLAYVDAS